MEFIDEPLMSCSSSALLRRPPRCICFTARLCNFGFQPEALNRAFLDIFEKILVLQNFFFVQNYPPALQKPFLQIQRVPLWMLKKKILQIKFLSKPCCGICSHDSKMVKDLGIANIFCNFFFFKLEKNILKNIFD